jgi:DNA-binding transcriptional regulator YiaG
MTPSCAHSSNCSNQARSKNTTTKGEKNMTGNDLRRLRQKLNLSQTKIAELLDYNSKTYIARLEARRNKRLPKSTVFRLKYLQLANPQKLS